MRRMAMACVLALVFGAVALAGGEGAIVAHYSFDEGSGDVLHDISGNGNHGKIQGAKFVKNGDGYALQFDGVDDFVDFGESKRLIVNTMISIEARVKLAAE